MGPSSAVVGDGDTVVVVRTALRPVVLLVAIACGCTPVDDEDFGSTGRDQVPATGTGAEGDDTAPVARRSDDARATVDGAVDGGAPGTNGVPSSGDVLDPLAALDLLAVAPERRSGYDRDLFDHWVDDDGDGCNTRHEVLARDSATPVQLDPFGCVVVAGDWFSPYDDRWYTDPSALDIDHVVALAEAWDSGAWSWDPARRRAFANDLGDPRSLRAVTDSVNRAKSDQDPADWLPPALTHRCDYLLDWVAVKLRWGLAVDERERSALQSHFTGPCAGAPGPLVDYAPAATVTADAVDGAVDGTVWFPNCAAARAVGAAPLSTTTPGYRQALDRDGDGVACE